jgi:hypothetical protein
LYSGCDSSIPLTVGTYSQILGCEKILAKEHSMTVRIEDAVDTLDLSIAIVATVLSDDL